MSWIYVVPQAHCVIIERFGRFHRLHQEGLHFRVPILDKFRHVARWWGGVANKDGHLIELSEQQTDTPARQCHTKDNVPVTANASVYWRITDPRRAVYEVDVLPQSITDIALNALRSNIGALELDVVLSERQSLNERIAAQLTSTAQKWGIVFTRVEIQEITTTEKVATAMVQQMDAERRRRAMISEARGKADAEIAVAEAEKQALVLKAEGRARALAAIAEAEMQYIQRLSAEIGVAEATRLLLAQKYLDGFAIITQNPANKVFLPSSFSGLYVSESSQNGEFAQGGSL